MFVKSKYSLVEMIAVLVSGILLAGCASMTTDLEKQGDVIVETIPVNNVRYLYKHVTQKAMTVSVSGTVSVDHAPSQSAHVLPS